MKIHLQNIERDIQEAIFLKAEEIVRLDQILRFVELEKNIWTAQIKEGHQYEVEAEFSGNYLKSSTCECKEFDKKNLCSHVVALMLKIRPVKIKPTKTIEEIVIPKKKQDRFNITSLVESIEEQDLKKFVKNYARQNKDFSIAIKAKFAGGMKDLQGPGKFTQILEESRKSNRRIGKAFNLQGQRNYLRVVKELVSQAEVALNEMHFATCGELLLSILQELPMNLSFVVKSKHPILQPLRQSYELLGELLEYPLAPELLSEIQKFLLAQLDLEGTAGKYTQYFVLDLIKSIKRSKNFNILLLKKINDLLSETKINSQSYEYLETVRIDLMLSLDQDPFSTTALSPSHPVILLKLLEHQLKIENFEALKQTISFAKNLDLEGEVEDAIDEFWLKYARAIHDEELILQVAELRLIKSFDPVYLEEIKALIGRDWSKKLPSLLEKIFKQPYSIVQRDLVALIFRKEEKPEALLAYIEQLDSLDLMQQYGSWLHAFLPDEIQLAYPALIKHYAEQHIGPKANEKIKLNLLEIKKILGPAEMKLLKEYLVQKYTHTSLLKKLETKAI